MSSSLAWRLAGPLALTLAVPAASQAPAPPQGQTTAPQAPVAPPTSDPAPAIAPAPIGVLPDQDHPAAATETLGLRYIETRMTVPVSISGHGPYDFIVDTGSERTVVSRELAHDLAMGPGPDAIVHSMTEVSRIPTVVLTGLQVGQRHMADINAPALSGTNLGAQGILGVDALQSARVLLDFERRQMQVMPSMRSDGRWPDGTIVVTARSRFGRLMLVDASVDGQRVWVIVDTGSEVTVANNALRRALEAHHRLGTTAPLTVLSVTGGRFTADYAVAHMIRIGGADISNLPIAFADAHPFRQLGLMDRPALLLGMDALRLFMRVSVDFPNRMVKLLPPESIRNGMIVRTASSGTSLIQAR